MISQLLSDLWNKTSPRQTLSALRREIKNPDNLEDCITLTASHTEELCTLLKSEDAKTRKNAALFLGELGRAEYVTPLYHAYEAETQRFVKSSYLSALGNLDYTDYIPQLENQLETLRTIELNTENRKHLEEEMHALSDLILAKKGSQMHTYSGFSHSVDCIFLCSRTHPEVTQAQIEELDEDALIKKMPAGLRVQTKHLDSLLPIRTYTELLFVIPGMATCPSDPLAAAKKIASSDLLSFLTDGHKEAGPFYFRLDLKSKLPLDKKSAFAKKMAAALEQAVNHQLINSTSHYELEIRLVENKTGTFNTVVKLGTILDHRFDYRKEYIAAGIRPVNAALFVQLTKDYMAEDAQVLDPFCGVGTMLIERQKAVKANTSYGIDLSRDAIEKAKKNTAAADNIIHYVHKDFFRFTHEYLFDEIFTDMPFAMGYQSEDDIYEIYEQFFRHAPRVLTRKGRCILYTRNRSYVTYFAGKCGFQILKQYLISKKEETYLFVLEREDSQN